MLLQRLVEYSGRLPSSPVMYQRTAIKWLIEINGAGELLAISPTSDAKKENARGKEFQAPHIGRSLDIRAKLLADNGEYVFGLPREASDPVRVHKCHLAFRALTADAAAKTGEAAVKAVCRFYDKTDLSLLSYPDDLTPADVFAFSVEGVIPFELAALQRFWALHTGAQKTGQEEAAYPCIVCGEVKPAVRRLPFKIKNIPNGQFAGNVLISANSPSFESYGLEESLISPICSEDAEKFSKGANALLECQDTRLTVGPLAYIFWTREETGFPFARLLSNPDPAELQTFLASAGTWHDAASGLDDSDFYAAAFSASGARVAVRDWLETTVGNARQNLARYYRLQRIAEPDGGEFKPMGIAALCGFTVSSRLEKPDYDKLSANVPQLFLRCALAGKPLPDWLLYQVVTRVRAARRVLKGHAMIIKMVLASQAEVTNQRANDMEQMDLTNRDPAYLCGRLLGLLQSLQYSALGRTSANIVGRHYGAASCAPASAFGALLRGAQLHLDSLRQTREGTRIAWQLKLEEVQSGLASFPKVLNLKNQGVFALGYYHQRAQDRLPCRSEADADHESI